MLMYCKRNNYALYSEYSICLNEFLKKKEMFKTGYPVKKTNS